MGTESGAALGGSRDDSSRDDGSRSAQTIARRARQRDGGRRAQTVAEIKAIALRHLDHGGLPALSLRAVARELGVSVQALYYYYPSRESLVTDLVTDSFTGLTDAVTAGAAAAGGQRPMHPEALQASAPTEPTSATPATSGTAPTPPTAPTPATPATSGTAPTPPTAPTPATPATSGTAPTPATEPTPGTRPSVAAGLAYRRWAVEHRSAFLLIFGTPLPGYGAPPDGPTSAAAAALGRAFVDAVFAGWTSEELERLPTPPTARRQAAVVPSAPPTTGAGRELPAGAAAAFTTGWALLYGHVMLELLGHAPWLGSGGEVALEAALLDHAAALDAARTHP
ncbi:MAG: TetR/AcrR family transcriptional regulator [Dermatophilaceae bacterium]